MPGLKIVRLVLWGLVAAALAFGAVLFAQQRSGGDVTLLPDVTLGAPFSLVDHTGAPITEQAFSGRPVALFFGFTHCPEICPTTMYELSGWLEQLGDEGKDIAAYFVTVDPERDTPDVLAGYIGAFPRLAGITGDPDGIAELARAWKVYWKKQPLDGGDYTMDHTASIFLVRRDGTLQGTIAYGENPGTALEKLRRLAAG
ncbi:MAG: SCO family protein [Rhizobiaceae bacterium]|nr:SCO family protein [Rhizobiaceae bacterium]